MSRGLQWRAGLLFGVEEMFGLKEGDGGGVGVLSGSKELSDVEMVELNKLELKFGRPH